MESKDQDVDELEIADIAFEMLWLGATYDRFER